MNTEHQHEHREAPPASQLAGLQLFTAVPDRYPHLFPSIEAARWYLREHRAGLYEAGALLMHRGRLMFLPAAFEQYVLQAGRNAAKRGVAA